ncbi:hypothetical protein NCU04752 [Neurospora crassa OR74A]|uniref:Uncharacterized protein n=2 Tax=Neurospora crassa TaxID=5141 RepID=Q7S6A1_NEUCR|nr:hypothetical protein NCU04752 [Neurospora crassa OR74A]EAA31049.1 hypothetical protein NCU04752 [Neurospora crassa OR74A]CAF06126.1 hypothetical protein H4H7.140 [Neurospora crassa]|eukprot:XP_960285.1 hypothetical protein NCU04752 [Neurospora crassa OR74A]
MFNRLRLWVIGLLTLFNGGGQDSKTPEPLSSNRLYLWVIGLLTLFSGGDQDSKTPKPSSSDRQKCHIYNKLYHDNTRSPSFPVGSLRPLGPIKSQSPTYPTSPTSHESSAEYSKLSLSPPKLAETVSDNHDPNIEPDPQSVFSNFEGRSDCPTPGFTYIILHHPTNRGLSIIKGEPTLHRVPEPKPGISHPLLLEGKTNWHWECVEADNWLSFRNAATGRFLGHDTDGNENPRWGNIRCSSRWPGISEKFAFLSLKSEDIASSVMLSKGEVDGSEIFEREDEDIVKDETTVKECRTAEGNIEDLGDVGKCEVKSEPQVQTVALYSLLVQPRKLAPSDHLHRITGCPYHEPRLRKLVKVQVKPESLAEGSQVLVVWDAEEDAGTVWRFVKVVPPGKKSVEEEVMA